jgi:hypothetical protein
MISPVFDIRHASEKSTWTSSYYLVTIYTWFGGSDTGASTIKNRISIAPSKKPPSRPPPMSITKWDHLRQILCESAEWLVSQDWTRNSGDSSNKPASKR